MRAGFDLFRWTKRAPASAGNDHAIFRSRLPVLLAALSFAGAAILFPGGVVLSLPGGAFLSLPGGAFLSFPGGAVLSFPGGAVLSFPGGAWAATPQPPRRPQFEQPTTPENAPSPQSAPQAAPAGRAPVDVDVDKLQPYNLPLASRERMHQCGEEWRKLKIEGRSAGLIWRGFAEKCLTR
jgi:hypothetical protein